MPGGRPPKPTQLKVLSGTARPDRVNGQEPMPPAGPVKPPVWLRGKARSAWRWLAPVLSQMGLLTTADPHALALLCEAYAEYIEARAIVRKLGMTYESKTVKAQTKRVTVEAEVGEGEGAAVDEADVAQWSIMIRARPEVAIAADAWRRVHRMMTDFGLTPSARGKLQAGPQEERDPLEEFLKGKKTADG